MSMRLWLPAALGLILVALVAVYVTAARHPPVTERPAPAARVSTAESRDEAVLPARERRKYLPHVPADPGVAAPAAEPALAVADEVAAAPAVVPTPEAAERDQQLQRLRASGPDVVGLTGKVQSMPGDWQTLAAKAGIDVRVSPIECYQAGCFTTMVFEGHDGVEDLTSKIFDSKAVAAWPGPKTRSAPLARPDGGAEVTWLLLPPADAPAGAAVGH